MTASIVALIPARGGSKRIQRKNLAELGGHPILAYSIISARSAGIFSGVYVSTEDAEIAKVAEAYGASVIERPAEYAADLAPDIGWVSHALRTMQRPDAFAILRPTSPFRSADTIRLAWQHLQAHGSYAVDSLRAVEPCNQHPFKMWHRQGELIAPLSDLIELPAVGTDAPLHSSPGQIFPAVLAQNASLEMAWSRVVKDDPPSISGRRVLPWTMSGYEGLDINGLDDLDYARWLVETGRATLPEMVR